MNFGVIGWQEMDIQVLPKEPWHAPMAISRRLLMINYVNCSILVVLLVLLAVFLPYRLKKSFGLHSKARLEKAVDYSPEPVPVNSENTVLTEPVDDNEGYTGEPRGRIFYWYRLTVRIILKITATVFSPQQTLREFSSESSGILGPASGHFTRLTGMVERLLYSRYKATGKDAENSRQLSDKIEKESGMSTTDMESGGNTTEENSNTVSMPEIDSTKAGLLNNLNSLLILILMLAVICYAVFMLFILPLIVA
jgi:hypothetical protein